LPKLLDFVKEKGYTHDKVMSILEAYSEPDEEEEESEPDEEEEEEEDTETTEVEDDTETDENNSEPEFLKITKDELNELISKAVEDKLKAKRKAPSKGKKGKGLAPKNVVRKNMFEVMV
jgi:hypothetical protein